MSAGAVIALLFLCLGAYTLGKNSTSDSAKAAAAAQEKAKDYNLLAKRLFTEDPNDSWVNFSTLRKEINDYYTNNNLAGSIYFEFLPTGTSIRINGDEEQVAASLIKLPAAMDLYKAAELGKVNLDDTVTLRQEWLDSQYGELYKKGAGYTLTLREAVKIMLEQSDNTALKAVSSKLANQLASDQNVFASLDMDFVQNQDLTVSIGARSYSSTLKCLYFACFNSKEDSQELLGYLTKSDFNSRIVAGVADKNIPVAHKIGTNFNKTQSDCGIVYYPKRNYVLCAMIQGPESAESDKHISEISKIVYRFIENIKPN